MIPCGEERTSSLFSRPMKPEISEFSYGYSVTEALAKRWRPDLNSRTGFSFADRGGGPGGGYDVKLERRGIPLFLQFKLSECMVRTSAAEVRQGLLALPFYRMPLRAARYSEQHQLLCELEQAGNSVRYAAPMFHTVVEFNEAYLNGQILRRSIFLRPSGIGPLPDDADHHVAFRDWKAWWFLSDPRRGDAPLDEETFDADVRHDIGERGATALGEPRLRALVHMMIAIVIRSGRRDTIAKRQEPDD
jgi:hypothetical protein